MDITIFKNTFYKYVLQLLIEVQHLQKGRILWFTFVFHKNNDGQGNVDLYNRTTMYRF